MFNIFTIYNYVEILFKKSMAKVFELINDFSMICISHNISKSDLRFIMELINVMDMDEYDSDFDDFFYNIRESFKDESNKCYSSSADEYIKAYEIIKDKIPYSKKSEAKKFFENKISKMKYKDALEDYNNEYYSSAIDKFKEYINDEYMTSDIKLDCRVQLVRSLVRYGIEQFNNEYYSNACEYLEEALNILNSYWQVKKRYGNFNSLKNKIGDAYVKIAKQHWSYHNTFSMETAFNYFRKAINYDYGKGIFSDYQLYYYLYKAYYESKSNRTSNLDMAKKFGDSMIIFEGNTKYFNDYVIAECYNKSVNIDNLQNTISQKENDIINLNYELNSVVNNINNIQSKINAKNIAINNKNTAITDLNRLADSLISEGSEINNKTEESVNEGKNQVEEVKKNIKDKKDFVEEIKKFESQKREEIENMKNNNKTLKEKNEQLFIMLNALELKLN